MPVRNEPVLEDSELSLLRALTRGEESAARALFAAHGDAVLRFVFRRVGENFEDAEEIAIDTFVSAMKMAAGYEPRSSVFTWLCGIAKLRIVDFYRQKDRAKRVPDSMLEALDELRSGQSSIDLILERIDAIKMVDAMLDTLSGEEREAVIMRYGDGLSIREIAHILQRTERGAESLLTRAKHKARTALADMLPEERQ